MSKLHRAAIAAAFLTLTTLAGCATHPKATPNPDADRAQLSARLQAFMNCYEKNDQACIVAMLDSRELLVLGSAITERVQTPDEFRALMTRDFGMWKSARFSEIRDLNMRVGTELATAYFLFTFTAESGPALPIRAVTTWRKSAGEWYLTQCANWVPEQR